MLSNPWYIATAYIFHTVAKVFQYTARDSIVALGVADPSGWAMSNECTEMEVFNVKNMNIYEELARDRELNVCV